MWVFGYGSLIWDNWEVARGCLRRREAELKGFRRVFNKGSVKNWGSKDTPCPTLNLTADPSSSCKGVAFEFREGDRRRVVDYLRKREGKGFDLQEQTALIEGNVRVNAIVPIYSGKNLLAARPPDELAAMARGANGCSGRCVEYITNIAMKLTELGINDPEVEKVYRALTLEKAL